MKLQHSITALVTPFKNNKIDETALARLIEWQIKNGTSAIVPCGTTGEASALTHNEYTDVLKICAGICKGRIPVVAGVSANSTDKAIEIANSAEKCGVDGLMVVVPYYVRPSQEGMYQHFQKVHEYTSTPFIIYNVPHRVGSEITVDTVLRLSKLERCRGIKDASTNLTRAIELFEKADRAFTLLSGDDFTGLAYRAYGGQGTISVASNVAPRLSSDLHVASSNNDIEKARKLNYDVFRLADVLFSEPSPSPTKFALEVMGFCTSEVRLPSVPVSDNTKKGIIGLLKELGLH